jgi:hypothetical protein
VSSVFVCSSRISYDAACNSVFKVLMTDNSNLLRSELVTKLADVGLETSNPDVQKWCSGQQDDILRSLKSLEPEQVDWLIEQIKKRDAAFIRDV